MPSSLADEFALAAAVGDGRAEMAVGVCWTVPGWAPGTVLSVVAAPPEDDPTPYGVGVGPVVVVVVSACAGPDEKATRPKMATAPTRAAGAARRAFRDLRGCASIT